MEILAYSVLILLSAAGYSAGAALRAGKRHVVPRLLDLLAIGSVWAAASVSRAVWGWDRWVAIPVWLAAGLAAGLVLSRPTIAGARAPGHDAPLETRTGAGRPGRVRSGWKRFSRKMGNFQSRVILSWLFFLFVAPFALAVRVFSDPLNIKHRKRASRWLERGEVPADLEAAGRQF